MFESLIGLFGAILLIAFQIFIIVLLVIVTCLLIYAMWQLLSAIIIGIKDTFWKKE